MDKIYLDVDDADMKHFVDCMENGLRRLSFEVCKSTNVEVFTEASEIVYQFMICVSVGWISEDSYKVISESLSKLCRLCVYSNCNSYALCDAYRYVKDLWDDYIK